MRVISASEAASLIEPGDNVLVSGSGGGHGVPEAILEAIEARYLDDRRAARPLTSSSGAASATAS